MIRTDDYFERNRPSQLTEIVGNTKSKKLLANMLATNRMPKGALFHGPAGCGKTTAARIIARALSCESDSKVPCGDCGSCRHPLGYPRYLTSGIFCRNASVLTLAALEHDLEYASAYDERPVVLLYDEAHRAPERIQDLLVTALEDSRLNFVLLLTTLQPEKLDGPLAQRMTSVKFSEPSITELIHHLGTVATRERWPVCDLELASIAKDNRSVRAAMNALYVRQMQNYDGALTSEAS
jgi:DNA polymerase III subunit gamma/tau